MANLLDHSFLYTNGVIFVPGAQMWCYIYKDNWKNMFCE